MANLDYVPFPELDSGGNIAYIQYDNNQTAITNLNYVEWANILSNPLQSNDTNDIIYRGNRVGIGLYENQIPVSKIHLIGDLFITENLDTWDFLRFYHTGNIAYQDFGGCEDGVSFRMNTGTTSFQDNPSLTEIMRFRNNKIGILNNNPQYSFDVNGSLNSTSLYVNDVSLNTIINTLIDDRNYLTISTASLTYATITNLSTKENALTFSTPLIRNSDNISINLSSYATNTNLNLKQDLLSNGTLLLGNASNITNINYNNIPNKPDLSIYDTITARASAVSLKQDLLSNGTLLLGNASNITNINYNNIPNKPDLSIYDTITARASAVSLKQDVLSNGTLLLGNASNITNINYNNIPNKPDLSIYDTITARASAVSLKQDVLSNGTLLLGNASNITNINYNNIPNKPDLSIYATITNLNTKENALTFSAPLTRTTNTISLDLSSYLTSATASSTYATITNLNTKENALTFSAPLTRTTNTISLDLSSYDTIALRNTALSSYLTTASASSTYATITNLNTKENALTFSAPLTRTTNTISLDLSSYDTIALRNTALSSYLTTASASSTYATITNLNTKENALTFSAPLTRTTNTISLDLSSYDTIALRNTALSSYLTTASASSTYATITNLNTKENALTFSAPLIRTTNTISLDTSAYITTTNANALNSRFFNNNGNNHGNYTDFNSPTQFGYNYILGTANGPGVNGAGQYYSWDIGLGANYGFGTYRAQFALPRNVANPYLCVRYQENGGYGGWNRISAGYADSANVANSLSGGDKTISGSLTCGVITALVYAINNTGTDYLGVSYNFPDTTTGVYRPIWAMLGSFTGFHRCFTNDELFDNTTDETIKDFKFKYAGRVVIASGNIATDDSNNDDNDDNKSWTIHYDKEGITLEDALPIVQLSRQRKDKRVFGVFGLPKRNNSRIERMIINSVGEGGIWVVNTNGNIENGDYLQTSNELGYAEKQDDDLLHNYTVGKATIECNFELNSNKYETLILENGVKASFIACSYHCG